ncbi:outer membrane protein assembly factor BamB [Iodobacter fluviatilis]|uniref:Outer membrane protein assembly factor BamB n=1 Tax=Iodobacter fluviatilis TaxID=537 RepID=A0A377Q8G7_9NEIS|nr:outer membrane protein assembly factor BamB [Iodobacter fluviatilis]TCU89499.1 Beta-barrel assembly machine subunit BamB [Iodobacter fluviatilis]STQ90869.1 Lipoprotein yfgL precursor [Iodobacter fluviatilis]
MQDLYRLVVAVSLLGLSACSTVSNAPEPSPLPVISQSLSVSSQWRASVGDKTLFRFVPAVDGDLIVVAGSPDKLQALDATSGNSRWQIKTEQAIAGGVGLGNDVIAVGSVKGVVLAYDRGGKFLWRAQASSEIMAPPAVAKGIVVVKTGDGRVSAYAAADGKQLWQYQKQLPALILRNYAAVTISGNVVYAGLSGGRLVAISLQDGRVLWDSPVAIPHGATELERVTDVVAPPVVDGRLVCAVAYQGRVACFDAVSGSAAWTRELSSWSGLAMDYRYVYAVDAAGNVNAFERESGRSVWRQDKLAARSVTAPAVLGKYLVVADFAGYTHFLNTEDGSFAAQQATDGARIAVSPLVVGEHLLVQTLSGNVFSIGLSK